MNFMRDLAQTGVLAVIVAFIGLLFTYNNSRSLARQSEANAIINAIEKTLQEISDENYKFWRDVTERNTEHDIKCRLFNAFIVFRCNLLEEKTQQLNRKCRSFFHDHIDHDGFETAMVKLIANVRDKATHNSESPDLVKDKVLRVLSINKETAKIFSTVHDFSHQRYGSGSETFNY